MINVATPTQSMDHIEFNGWQFLSYKGPLAGILTIEVINYGVSLEKIKVDVNARYPITEIYSKLVARGLAPTSNSRYKLDPWLNDQVSRC